MRWKSLNAKHGIDIQSPESLKTMEFDNLLITTKKFQACYRCAKELGIEYEKIIAFWGSELTNYSFVNWFAWKYALAIEKEKIMQNRLV